MYELARRHPTLAGMSRVRLLLSVLLPPHFTLSIFSLNSLFLSSSHFTLSIFTSLHSFYLHLTLLYLSSPHFTLSIFTSLHSIYLHLTSLFLSSFFTSLHSFYLHSSPHFTLSIFTSLHSFYLHSSPHFTLSIFILHLTSLFLSSPHFTLSIFILHLTSLFLSSPHFTPSIFLLPHLAISCYSCITEDLESQGYVLLVVNQRTRANSRELANTDTPLNSAERSPEFTLVRPGSRVLRRKLINGSPENSFVE